MHWFVVIHRHPLNVEYSDVPKSQVMGLIRGHLEDPNVYGFEAIPANATQQARPTAAAPLRPYRMAA